MTTSKERIIIEALQSQGEAATADSIADDLEMTVKALTKALNGMARKKLIVKSGVGASATYEASEDFEDFEEPDPDPVESPNVKRYPIAKVANDVGTTPTYIKSLCRQKGVKIHPHGLTGKEISKISPAE